MTTFYHPWIAQENFEAFRRVHHPYPNTYDEWLQFHARRVAHDKAKGHETIDVEVDPDEFTKFCKVCGCTPDREALDSFAFEKGTKNDRNEDHSLVALAGIANGVAEFRGGTPDDYRPRTRV